MSLSAINFQNTAAPGPVIGPRLNAAAEPGSILAIRFAILMTILFRSGSLGLGAISFSASCCVILLLQIGEVRQLGRRVDQTLRAVVRPQKHHVPLPGHGNGE